MILNNGGCSICCKTDVSPNRFHQGKDTPHNHIHSAADTQSGSSCHLEFFFVFRLECVFHHLLNLFLTYISCNHCGTTF